MIDQEVLNNSVDASKALALLLEQKKLRIVFAESCTAGLVSALMASNPGISNWMCGSAATYREATKCQWLEIDPGVIQQHTAVSEPVTCEMASQVLAKTPEANIALAITGHLELDAGLNAGHCFIALAFRSDQVSAPVHVTKKHLDGESRVARQWNAAILAIKFATQLLSSE